MPSTKLLMITSLLPLLLAAGWADALPLYEARACCGLTPADADLPLRSDAVEGLSSIYRNTRSGRHLLGVSVAYRSGLGVAPEKLEAALECQIARGRAQTSADSPLAVKHVQARVRADGERLRVEITSEYASSAAEILQRARRHFAIAMR